MKKTYLVLAFLITSFLLAGDAYGEDEVYYCAEIDANGFEFDETLKKYKRSGFVAEKFEIKLDRVSKTIELVSEDGSRTKYLCKKPFMEETISCTKNFYHFNFNHDEGKFVSFRGYGYVGRFLNDSLHISYGKCDKF